MERVGTLINKLKEQFEQQAGGERLLATAQLLLAELQHHQNNSPAAKGKVSVVMPWSNQQVDERIVETNQSAETPAATVVPGPQTVQSKTIPPKKEENSGWLFDPFVAIPTLAHQDRDENEVYELNDVMHNGESLNDKLKEDKTEVATVLHGAIVRDLKKAIGFNDRHLFINELFRGDEDMYERSIKTINGFSIYPEAEYWIQRELKVKIGWNDKNEAVKLFDQLVKRRFS